MVEINWDAVAAHKDFNRCATVSVREPAFKAGDKVCFADRTDIYIGSISPDSFIGQFTGIYHIFASDQYFENFARYGGPNTIKVSEEYLKLYKHGENN